MASARRAFTRDDVPPGSWIQNAGGTAALGIKVVRPARHPGAVVADGVRPPVRLRVPGHAAAGDDRRVRRRLLDDRHPGRLARLRVRRGRPDLAPPRRSRSCASSGPLLTAAIVAGTLGATITAEIGARKIREELLALEVLGINPVRNLILPRVVGLALWMPVLAPAHVLGRHRRDVHRRPSSSTTPRRRRSSASC